MKTTARDAVLRLVRNPDGYLSETEGNYTDIFGRIFATESWRSLNQEWETFDFVSGAAQLVTTFSDAPATPVHPFTMGG